MPYSKHVTDRCAKMVLMPSTVVLTAWQWQCHTHLSIRLTTGLACRLLSCVCWSQFAYWSHSWFHSSTSSQCENCVNCAYSQLIVFLCNADLKQKAVLDFIAACCMCNCAFCRIQVYVMDSCSYCAPKDFASQKMYFLFSKKFKFCGNVATCFGLGRPSCSVY